MKYGGVPNHFKDIFQQLNQKKVWFQQLRTFLQNGPDLLGEFFFFLNSFI